MGNILACEYIPYFMVSVGYLFKIISNLPEMNRYIVYNSGTMYVLGSLCRKNGNVNLVCFRVQYLTKYGSLNHY